MILVGCGKDGDWKVGGWIFRYLGTKKGEFVTHLWRICNQTTNYLRAMYDMPNTDDTSDFDTENPLLADAAVS